MIITLVKFPPPKMREQNATIKSKVMMKNSHNFLLKYDGAAVASNTMEVSQLAPALMALSDALSGLNQLTNKDNAKVSLQVRALNKGSFIVDLELLQDYLCQLGSLLTGTGVSAYCNASTIVASLIEIFTLKKWLDGRKPDHIQISEDHKQVTFELKTETFTISYSAYQGFRNSAINSACTQIAAPLSQDGFDSFSISDTQQIAAFTKQDLPALGAAPEDEVLTSHTAKCVVMIETAAFKDKAKWKVKIGDQNSVFVSIQDEEFLKNIDNGTELFGKGDVLLVDMETKQLLSSGKLTIQYTITKVHQHKRSPEQLSMF